jgi:hypothetical protein
MIRSKPCLPDGKPINSFEENLGSTICWNQQDWEIRVSYTYLELVYMQKAIQWQSNKHKLHCVDGLAALLHTTAYYIPGL